MMTTNQTIDGVSRDLMEASWAALMQKGQVLKALQLRDLLDAPAPIPTPVAWMRFDDDQKAIFTRSKRVSKSEPLYAHPTAYRHTTPAAQPQGEQVATVMNQPYGMVFTDYKESEFPIGVHVDLYAEQPAPVAVKEYQNKINHLKQLLRNVRATLHFTPEDVLAIDAALREDE